MYVIKAVPEDFIVKEVGSPAPPGNGPYAYFVLQKRGWNTLEALEVIALKTNSTIKQFGWAGNKDRQAVTTQVCSAKNVAPAALEKLTINGITITYLGQGGKPVVLGSHQGNEFIVTIRNLEEQTVFKQRFVNLFGGQRFGSHNAAIGRALVKGQWAVAIDHLSHDAKRSSAMREALSEHPTDTLGALRHLPHKLLQFFIHAYQSELWNSAAGVLAGQGAAQQDIPIIGFGTTDADLERLPIIKETCKAEAITPRSFVLKAIPTLSSEGGARQLYTDAHNLVVEKVQDDEMNPGKKKTLVRFSLDKGSYATEFIRQGFRTP